MPKVYVTDRAGLEKALDIRPELKLMQIITDAGMDELLALCGGVCSCGTCHVHVDEKFMLALAPMDADESGVLAASSHRQANSRLSCQIRMSDELDGLRVTIAPED